MAESNLILGLDLGITSVGWALLKILSENNEAIHIEIVATGVRIFPATTEGAKNEPKNRSRRDARGSRRMLRRKRQRRQKVRALLEANGLLPSMRDQIEADFDQLGDPYMLRGRAVTENLNPTKLDVLFFT